jgi:hypothetical protein
LEKQLNDDGQQAHGLLTLLYAAAQGERAFENRLREYKTLLALRGAARLPIPTQELIDALREHAAVRTRCNSHGSDFTYEDVYQFALTKLANWRHYNEPVPPTEKCLQLYRGQRDVGWSIGATIYRDLPKGAARREALDARVEAIRKLGSAVAAKLRIPFSDAIAVCQHYSDKENLGLATWLVDFSRDPWTGLFFASDHGEQGAVGVLWNISVSEYADHTVGRGNPIGPLQLTVPQGVQRIDNQAGVFVTAGLPQFFNQYVAFGEGTRFHQHDGLVFEDALLGVSRARIYPPDDPLRQTLLEIKAADADRSEGTEIDDAIVPAAVVSDPDNSQTYHDLLTAWLNAAEIRRSESSSASVRATLRLLADFHALLHSPRYVGRLPEIMSRSLNRLRTAFHYIDQAKSNGRDPSARAAIERSYLQHYDFHREVLCEALQEVLQRDAED